MKAKYQWYLEGKSAGRFECLYTSIEDKGYKLFLLLIGDIFAKSIRIYVFLRQYNLGKIDVLNGEILDTNFVGEYKLNEGETSTNNLFKREFSTKTLDEVKVLIGLDKL